MSSYWEELERLRAGGDADTSEEDEFDREYFRRFGRLPPGSKVTVEPPRVDRRRHAIEQLAEHGATPGERAAAQAALQRLDLADAIGEFPAHQFEQDDPNEED